LFDIYQVFPDLCLFFYNKVIRLYTIKSYQFDWSGNKSSLILWCDLGNYKTLKSHWNDWNFNKNNYL